MLYTIVMVQKLKPSALKKPLLKKPLSKRFSSKPSALKKPLTKPSSIKTPPSSKPDLGRYAFKVGIIFAFCHFVFAFFISVWGLHRSIIQTEHTSHLFYLLELPGALCAQAVGQTNPTEAMPYLIVFFINTIFYLFVGIGIGHLIHKLNLVEDIDNLILTDEEIMEKYFEKTKIPQASPNQPPVARGDPEVST